MHRGPVVFLVIVIAWWCLTTPPVTDAVTPQPLGVVGGPVDGTVAVTPRAAARLRVGVGDVLSVSGFASMAHPLRLRIAGVWDVREHPADAAKPEPVLLLHLPDLQRLLGKTDEVDRIVVRFRPDADAATVRDDLNALRTGIEAYTAPDLAKESSRTFLVISRFHRAISVVTLLASGIFLLTIMWLKLSEMRHEVGALRLLGMSPGTIALVIIGVAAAVSVAGAALGLGLGVAMARTINAYYQRLFATTLEFAAVTPSVLGAAALLSAVLGAAAGIVASVRLLRQRPLDQMGR